MTQYTRRDFFGVLIFPVAGFLFVLTSFVPGIDINPSTDPAGFARASDLVGMANLVGLVGLVLLLFGFHSLYSILAHTAIDRPAYIGMLLSTAGIALLIPFIGIFAFAAPVAGRLYLNGQQSAIMVIAMATDTSNPYTLIFGGLSLLFYIVGSVLFAIAIWQSGRLPKWAAIPYALSPIGAIPSYNSALFLLGGVLLFAAGLGITLRIWNHQEV
jgi:hypothetical protein